MHRRKGTGRIDTALSLMASIYGGTTPPWNGKVSHAKKESDIAIWRADRTKESCNDNNTVY